MAHQLAEDRVLPAEFAKRFMDVWNAHDIDRLMALLTDDIVWIDPTMPAPLEGAGAVRDFLHNGLRAFPDLHFTEADRPHVTADEDNVAKAWVMEGTMLGDLDPPGFAPTGRRMRVEGVDLWLMREGKIAVYRTFYDVTHIARQLGIMPMYGSRAERGLVTLQRLQARLLRK